MAGCFYKLGVHSLGVLIISPARVLRQDLCPLGLPDLSDVAHLVPKRNSTASHEKDKNGSQNPSPWKE